MAFKKERLEKIIEREISNIILHEVKDDRLRFVTITQVNLTNDLSLATIYYSVLGTEEQIAATVETLLEAKGYIRSILSKKLEIKKTPDLRFKYDDSFNTGNRIEEILKSIKEN